MLGSAASNAANLLTAHPRMPVTPTTSSVPAMTANVLTATTPRRTVGAPASHPSLTGQTECSGQAHTHSMLSWCQPARSTNDPSRGAHYNHLGPSETRLAGDPSQCTEQCRSECCHGRACVWVRCSQSLCLTNAMQADEVQVEKEQPGLECLLRGGDIANKTTFQDYIQYKPPRCALLPGLVSASSAWQ